MYQLLFDDPKVCLEDANQLLLGVVWHEECDPKGHLTSARNRIADLLRIPLAPEQRDVNIVRRGNAKSLPKDEFESYSALVNSAS